MNGAVILASMRVGKYILTPHRWLLKSPIAWLKKRWVVQVYAGLREVYYHVCSILSSPSITTIHNASLHHHFTVYACVHQLFKSLSSHGLCDIALLSGREDISYTHTHIGSQVCVYNQADIQTGNDTHIHACTHAHTHACTHTHKQLKKHMTLRRRTRIPHVSYLQSVAAVMTYCSTEAHSKCVIQIYFMLHIKWTQAPIQALVNHRRARL